MSPTIDEGDILIVKRCTDVPHRAIAIVQVNDDVFVRRVCKTEHGVILVPDNRTDYDPIIADGRDFKISGMVKEIRKSA